MYDEYTVIYGKHAVIEAITARPDVVKAVHIGEPVDTFISARAKEAGITLEEWKPKKLGIPHDAVHQNVAALVDLSKLVVSFEAFLEKLTITDDTALAVLGEVQDPHNVGALIRSAAAFGISGVLVPEHRQVQINGTVVKVSTGMAFRVPLVRIGNVNQTIFDLKEKGFWIYGLDSNAPQTLDDEKFEKPSVFVLGNEGSGIREKTMEHCDIPLQIPMHKNAESLNASVAGAVVFYAWSVHHQHALQK